MCNQAMHQMLGYAEGELNNLNMNCIHPEEDLPYVLEQFKKFGQEERLMALDIPLKKKDGSVFYVDISSTHLMMHGRKCLMGNFRDITERKQADEKLRKSEARYRLLAEHTKDIVWLMDMDTRTSYQSPSSEILRGFTSQELRDLPLEKNLTPESLKLAMELLFSEIPKIEADPGYNPVLMLELEYYRKDGATMWLENKFSVIRDEGGKPVSILGEGRDITERKKAEAALKESEERFRALYDRSLYAVYIHDLEGNFIDANQYALDLLGYRRDEIVSINFGKLLSPDKLALAIKTTMELIEGGKQSEITEYTLKGKGGKYVHIETTATILYRESKPYAVLGIALDITKRKEIEAELIMSEKKYRLLADNVTDVIWMSDMNLNTTYISPSVYAMQGHTPEEAMKLSYEQRFTPDSLVKLRAIFADAMEKEKKGIQLPDNIGTFEAEYYRKDGSTYWTETRASFIRDKTEKAVAIMGVTRDISLKKKAEADKVKLEIQNRQLQKSESLGRMAASIAHHFNNQLGVVIGNLELAIGDQPKDAPSSKSLAAAMKAAWNSADMSGLMLTYLGQTHDKVEPVDLAYCCHKILPILKAAIPANVVMEASISSSGSIINANTDHIQQILTNLITNAHEAVGKTAGTIYLKVKTDSPAEISTKNRFPVDWQPQNDAYACLEVTDTGCGIEEKNIEKLFDPFYTTKFTGRGMGLAVVMGLVNSHKGVITVDSEPGSGSTFCLFFPVSEEAGRKPQAIEIDRDVTISSLAQRKMEEVGTVLAVEDEEMLRNVVGAMLESFGFTVLKAKDGIEALEIFRQYQSEIKFVLSDLTMPRMDGWETLTALRKLQPGLPVILASGYDLAHVMEGDHPELPQAFLAKPYSLKALRNAISQALGSGKK